MSVLDQKEEEVFKKFDYNDNKVLELNEVMKLLSIIAKDLEIKTPSEDEVKKLIKTFDEDNDGRIDFGEFKKMFPALKKMDD